MYKMYTWYMSAKHTSGERVTKRSGAGAVVKRRSTVERSRSGSFAKRTIVSKHKHGEGDFEHTASLESVIKEKLERLGPGQTAEVRVMTTAEVRAKLSDALGRVAYGGERVLIGKHGKPMAALVSLADLQALRAIEDAIDLEEVRKVRAEGAETISHDEVGRNLGFR